MKKVLSIAGSDCSGGAGIQADIKTMTANGVYAMSVITALTSQNTTKVFDIFEVTPDFLASQIDAVFSDIRPDAVKIGMVQSKEMIDVIAEKLIFYHAENIVLDPVMIATSGSRLIKTNDVTHLIEKLFTVADLVTPNIPEAEIITQTDIRTENDMIYAAEKIHKNYGVSVLLKGGHNLTDASDLLYTDSEIKWFKSKRFDNPNTHGTGCTLSSAIAANLSKGFSVYDSVAKAKEYISGAIMAMLDIGLGSGPVNHLFGIKSKFTEEGIEK